MERQPQVNTLQEISDSLLIKGHGEDYIEAEEKVHVIEKKLRQLLEQVSQDLVSLQGRQVSPLVASKSKDVLLGTGRQYGSLALGGGGGCRHVVRAESKVLPLPSCAALKSYTSSLMLFCHLRGEHYSAYAFIGWPVKNQPVPLSFLTCLQDLRVLVTVLFEM